MAYILSSLLHATFDTYPFVNEVSGASCTGYLTPPSLINGKFEKAWQMATNSYVRFTMSDPTTGLSIGFWLKPSNPGMIAGPGGTTESAIMPLLSKCVLTTVGTTTTASNICFLVYEKTNDDDTNVLVLELKSGYKLISSAYSANYYHHFWITYNGSIVKLYIDGGEDTGATATGSVPATISATGQPLYINYLCPGSDYNIVRNTGVLDDLLILNASVSSIGSIVKAANMGAAYIADQSINTEDEINQALVFDDPSTTQINGLFANRGNVYVARSDGKLLKGVRSVWESRHDFYNEKEINYLDIQSRGDTSASISNGILKLTNEVARI